MRERANILHGISSASLHIHKLVWPNQQAAVTS